MRTYYGTTQHRVTLIAPESTWVAREDRASTKSVPSPAVVVRLHRSDDLTEDDWQVRVAYPTAGERGFRYSKPKLLNVRSFLSRYRREDERPHEPEPKQTRAHLAKYTASLERRIRELEESQIVVLHRLHEAEKFLRSRYGWSPSKPPQAKAPEGKPEVTTLVQGARR